MNTTAISPAEALRLSRARTLAEQCGSAEDGKAIFMFTVEDVAVLIDKACASRDATILQLREQVQALELSNALENSTMDAGDTVHHAPSGEDWVVGRYDDKRGEVYYLGYPPGGWGKSADCKLIEKATPAKRVETLREIAKGMHPLASWARDVLAREGWVRG